MKNSIIKYFAIFVIFTIVGLFVEEPALAVGLAGVVGILHLRFMYWLIKRRIKNWP